MQSCGQGRMLVSNLFFFLLYGVYRFKTTPRNDSHISFLQMLIQNIKYKVHPLSWKMMGTAFKFVLKNRRFKKCCYSIKVVLSPFFQCDIIIVSIETSLLQLERCQVINIHQPYCSTPVKMQFPKIIQLCFSTLYH
jgi:hypothetical protein